MGESNEGKPQSPNSMSSNTTDSTSNKFAAQTLHNPSVYVQVRAFVWTVIIFTTLVCATMVPLVGLFVYPLEVTVYAIIPYYAVAMFGRPEFQSGRPWRYFSENFVYLRAMRDYFGLSCVDPLPAEFVEAERRPNAQFLVACFPHGASSDFRILMEGALLPAIFPHSYSRVRTLAASVLFWLPLVREISLWTGCIDASRVVAERAIDRGHTLVVLPGGEREQLLTRKGEERLYLKKRLGFVKLALRKNLPLVPVYVFGTNDQYDVSLRGYSFRHWLMVNLGVCIMFQSGPYSTVCPYPVKTTVAVGPPLSYPIKTPGLPTKDEVTKAHQEFIDALTKLFDQHKGALGYGDRTLMIT